MKELWSSEKGKAGITLALWGVFIIFVFILIACSNTTNSNIQPTDKEQNVVHKVDVLLQSNTGFKMTIESKDLSQKIVYDSSFNKNNTYDGYVEDSLGINKFRCDTTCYKVTLDYEEEEPKYYDELVTTINYLKSIVPKLETIKNQGFKYVDKDKSTNIMVNDNMINKIIIESEDNTITFDINYNKNV